MEEYRIHQFDNGLRLVYTHHPSLITHCGFVVDAGSRDEEADIMGMAHFVEHMLFKGTTRRKAIHILNRLEFVGGEMNAYTSKDKTCVYASVASEHFTKAVEVLSDVVFHSVYPQKELEKEQKVICEEIDMYLDAPEENIMDVFQEMAFPGNPLGYNILGTPDTVNSFHTGKVKEFVRSRYTAEKIVFVYNGNRTFGQVVSLCRHYFDQAEAPASGFKRTYYDKGVYVPFSSTVDTTHTQTYAVMGGWAYPHTDERRVPFALLTNILGGPGLNSRLNLAIREKYGFSYDLEASYTGMQDIGFFSIYAGTDKKYLKRTLELIHKELVLLREKPISSLQLHRYKNQFKGQILMGEENRVNIALLTGKLILDERPMDPLQVIFDRIDKLTALQLQEAAVEIFDPRVMSNLVFQGS